MARSRTASPDSSSATLATLRDTLLPKLLSGELNVAKAVLSTANK